MKKLLVLEDIVELKPHCVLAWSIDGLDCSMHDIMDAYCNCFGFKRFV